MLFDGILSTEESERIGSTGERADASVCKSYAVAVLLRLTSAFTAGVFMKEPAFLSDLR